MSLVIINGYTIINSTALPGENRGTVVLGVRANNVHADDYEYVVGEVAEFKPEAAWPQGHYSRTLDLAVQRFNIEVADAKSEASLARIEADRKARIEAGEPEPPQYYLTIN